MVSGISALFWTAYSSSDQKQHWKPHITFLLRGESTVDRWISHKVVIVDIIIIIVVVIIIIITIIVVVVVVVAVSCHCRQHYHYHCHHYHHYHTSRSTNLKGVCWFHLVRLSLRLSVCLSVCPSVDRIVSALYLLQYSPDPFCIYTSYQGTSGVLRVKCFLKFKKKKCDFVLFWLGIQ